MSRGCILDLSGDPIWQVCRPLLPALGTMPPTCHGGTFFSPNNISLPTSALAVLLEGDGFGLGQPHNVSWLYEMTHLDVIPDISVTGRDFFTLLYETEFAPLDSGACKAEGLPKATHRTLVFEGINYQATVWINGVHHPSPPPGLFTRHCYDIGTTGGSFKVLIAPPFHPGVPLSNRQGGDHAMAQDGAIPQYTAGWDWVPSVPDRATGVAGEVAVLYHGRSRLVDCAVQTLAFVGPCDPLMQYCENIQLRIMADVVASVSNGPDLMLRVEHDGLLWGFMLNNTSGTINEEVLTNENRLCLWWPHGSMDPFEACLVDFLFTLLDVKTEKVIDQQRISVGIRTVETFVDSNLQGQRFRINGKDIYIVGGNWIGTDLTWKYSNSRRRYCDEIKLHQHAGLNLLRVWGGGTAERSVFYDCADRLGMLVLQEFWMTGDQNGRWAGNYSWPLDHNAYLYNVKDTVQRLRKHASLLLYVGCNECLAPLAEANPPRDVDTAIRELIQKHDPGRFYISSSMGGVPQSLYMNRSYSLAYADGPYGLLLPREFFNRNPGLNLGKVTVGFQPEIGSVGCPTYGGLGKFMNDTEIARGFPRRGANATNSSVWAFHKFEKWTTSRNETYDHVYTYFAESALVSDRDWIAGAQLALHKQYQSLFDGFVSHMFDYTTAVILWKSQSPWPSLRGFLYDWYLESTGALRGVRASLANPVSVVLDLKQFQLRIINRRVLPLRTESRMAARFSWIDLNGTIVEEGIAALKGNPKIEAMSSELLGEEALSWPLQCSSVCFLRVVAFSDTDISRTWYWLTREDAAKGDSPPDYSALGQLRHARSSQTDLRITICEIDDDYLDIEVHLWVLATSSTVLFYPNFEVWSGDTQLLPVFDDHDSDIVLVPGQVQKRRLRARRPTNRTRQICVTLNSWNAPISQSLEQPCSTNRLDPTVESKIKSQ